MSTPESSSKIPKSRPDAIPCQASILAFAVFLLIFLSGCASQYKISEAALRIQQSLTDDEAINNLVRYMSRTSTHAGLCLFVRSNYRQTRPDAYQSRVAPDLPLKIDGTSVVFFGEESTLLSTLQEGGLLQSWYAVKMKETKLNLNNIIRIRVQTAERVGYICKNAQEGYLLMLESLLGDPKEEVLYSYVNIGKGEIDGFIASIRKIRPQIRITEGIGL